MILAYVPAALTWYLTFGLFMTHGLTWWSVVSLSFAAWCTVNAVQVVVERNRRDGKDNEQ